MSAIDAVNKITERYAKVNKTVHLRHLSSDCRQLLENVDKFIEVKLWKTQRIKWLLINGLNKPTID